VEVISPRPRRLPIPLILGGAFLVFFSIAALFIRHIVTSRHGVNVTIADRERLLSVQELADAVGKDFAYDAYLERVTKERVADGVTAWKYRYPVEAADVGVLRSWGKDAKALSLESEVRHEADAALAHEVFVSWLPKDGVEPQADLFSAGDESKAGYVVENGARVGNFVVVRKGKGVFRFQSKGVAIEKTQTLTSLLTPKLELLANQ
jgi:hypothetical protein